MITKAGNGDNYAESELLAKLSSNESYSSIADGEQVPANVDLILPATVTRVPAFVLRETAVPQLQPLVLQLSPPLWVQLQHQLLVLQLHLSV